MADSLILGGSDDVHFAALTTNLQFTALRARCDRGAVASGVEKLPHLRNIKIGSDCDLPTVRKRLINGWSTERVLAVNHDDFGEETLRYSLHWAFPQAYYSAFAVAFAFFEAVGFTEWRHGAVIKKVGMEMAKGRYPSTISFLATGGKTRTHLNLSPSTLNSPMALNEGDAGEVDAHICRFLNGTRSDDLKERRTHHSFPRKTGKGPKQNLSATEWDTVGEALGPTSLLSLLYRKRIKANYEDIETFLHDDLDAAQVFAGLRRCVEALNYVHEAFISVALGLEWFESTVASAGEVPLVRGRLARIRKLHTPGADG